MIKKITSKSVFKSIAFLAITAVVLMGVCGCNKPKQTDKLFLDFMGTSVYVVINDSDNNVEKCYDEVQGILDDITQTFSTEIPTSLVSKFNRLSSGESLKVDEDFLTVFSGAKLAYESSNGAFDPCVKHLVDLWGFSSKYSQKDYVPTCSYDRVRLDSGAFPLPQEEYLLAFKTLCDFSLIDVEGDKIIKKCPSVTVNGEIFEQEIDLSAIVKGFASEKIKALIDSYGYKSYYLSLGTSSMYLSQNLDGTPFDLGITDPQNPSGATKLTIKVKERYVSTSGIYQNYYSLDGKTYHHIIDPKTGRPSQTDILSLTVIGESGEKCDWLTTSLMQLSSIDAENYLRQLEGYDFVIITENDIINSYEQ